MATKDVKNFVAVPVSMDTDRYHGYNKMASRILGILQILNGTILIILNIVLATTSISQQQSNSYYFSVWYIGSGWWASPFFILAGSFGIASSCTPTRSRVTTTMVFSIISCVMFAGVFGQGIATFLLVRCSYSYYNSYNPFNTASSTTTTASSASRCNLTTEYAVGGLFIAIGLFELIVAIVQSAYCCGKGCCPVIIQGTSLPHPENSYQKLVEAPIQGSQNNPVMPSMVMPNVGNARKELPPTPHNYLFHDNLGQENYEYLGLGDGNGQYLHTGGQGK